MQQLDEEIAHVNKLQTMETDCKKSVLLTAVTQQIQNI